jgi:ElaA protein
METFVKTFDELTTTELYEILKARAEVFIVEQDCVYQDLDDVDQEAYHVYLKEDGKIVAYLRVIGRGKRLDEVSIGRVITLRRHCGLGTTIMTLGFAVAREKFGAECIKIGAQVQAQPFYESIGFRVCSGEYMEDGIPHIYMIKRFT